MKGGCDNQQLLQARRDGTTLPGMKMISWRLTFWIPSVSLVASIIPGPTWASSPWGLLGWVRWKLVFIKKKTVLIALYTLSYLILTTLGVRYNKPLFVDKIIGSERLSNLAKITLHSKTGIEIFNCGPVKEINLWIAYWCCGVFGCGDRL